MLKCKYAGDTSDPGCKDCNGITMVYKDKEYDCSAICTGFEECEDSKTGIEIETAPNTPDNSKLKTTLIGCKSGLSKEINGVWYKFEAWEEKVVPDTGNVDVELERRMLFDKLNTYIDNQMIEAMGSK